MTDTTITINMFSVVKKYNAKAVISPVAKFSEDFTATGEENANYGHLLKKNIKEMYVSGLVEFQNHSYNMHTLTPRKGIGKNIRKVMMNIKLQLQMI